MTDKQDERRHGDVPEGSQGHAVDEATGKRVAIITLQAFSDDPVSQVLLKSDLIYLISQSIRQLVIGKEILVAPLDKIAPWIFRQPTEELSRPSCPFFVIVIADQCSEHQVRGS